MGVKNNTQLNYYTVIAWGEEEMEVISSSLCIILEKDRGNDIF